MNPACTVIQPPPRKIPTGIKYGMKAAAIQIMCGRSSPHENIKGKKPMNANSNRRTVGCAAKGTWSRLAIRSKCSPNRLTQIRKRQQVLLR